MQILETAKIKTKGPILDLGANFQDNNITNFLIKNTNITYADKFPKKNGVYIDLEVHKKLKKKFNYIFAMNVLEHIKNYRNVIQLSYNSLNKNGLLIGTTPFMFGVHFSPNDYHRFTFQLLKEDLEEVGFDDIKIKALSYGFFTNIYSLICNFTKKIPLLNILIITMCIFLDAIFFKINKNFKKNHPLGYYFFATKK
jgi:hypothetical protein